MSCENKVGQGGAGRGGGGALTDLVDKTIVVDIRVLHDTRKPSTRRPQEFQFFQRFLSPWQTELPVLICCSTASTTTKVRREVEKTKLD